MEALLKPRMKVSKSRSTGQALQRTEHMSNKVIQPDDATSVRAQLREILLSEIKEAAFLRVAASLPSETWRSDTAFRGHQYGKPLPS